jgi:hypothetical protein
MQFQNGSGTNGLYPPLQQETLFVQGNFNQAQAGTNVNNPYPLQQQGTRFAQGNFNQAQTGTNSPYPAQQQKTRLVQGNFNQERSSLRSQYKGPSSSISTWNKVRSSRRQPPGPRGKVRPKSGVEQSNEEHFSHGWQPQIHTTKPHKLNLTHRPTKTESNQHHAPSKNRTTYVHNHPDKYKPAAGHN